MGGCSSRRRATAAAKASASTAANAAIAEGKSAYQAAGTSCLHFFASCSVLICAFNISQSQSAIAAEPLGVHQVVHASKSWRGWGWWFTFTAQVASIAGEAAQKVVIAAGFCSQQAGRSGSLHTRTTDVRSDEGNVREQITITPTPRIKVSSFPPRFPRILNQQGFL